jgi:ABC-type nitrate/sulfonate/bicarbonate transport system permease component
VSIFNMGKGSMGRKTVLRLGSLVIIVILLEIVGINANPILFAPPSRVLVGLYGIAISGALLDACKDSFNTLIIGLILGTIPGILLGIFMGRYRLVQNIFEPFANALYSTPLIALIPLVLIWFGNGTAGKVFYIVLWVIFPVLINTFTGVKEVDRTLLEVASSFGAKENQLMKHVIWPYVIPFIVSGIRLAIGRGIVGLVVAEMSLRLSGFGGLLMRYGASFSTDVVFGVILILLLFGVALTQLVLFAETRVAPWKTKSESN